MRYFIVSTLAASIAQTLCACAPLPSEGADPNQTSITWAIADGNGLVYGANGNVALQLRVAGPAEGPATAANVLIKAARGGDTVAPGEVPVAHSGASRVLVRLGGAGTASFTATAGTVSASIDLEVASPDPSQTTLVFKPTSVVAGEQAALVTLWAKDNQKRNLVGVNLELSAADPTTQIRPSTLTTRKTGQDTVSVLAFTAGQHAFVAKGQGLSFSPTLTVTPAGIDGLKSTVLITPSAAATSGSYSANLVVTARDAYANPIAGVAVKLSTGAQQCAVAAPTGVTDAAGALGTTLTCTSRGAVTVVAAISPKRASPIWIRGSTTF